MAFCGERVELLPFILANEWRVRRTLTGSPQRRYSVELVAINRFFQAPGDAHAVRHSVLHGLVPGFGAGTDVVNGLWYAAEGQLRGRSLVLHVGRPPSNS